MKLKVQSSKDWLQCVLADFETFLQDHAANERKASSMAMSMVTHYPDRTQLTRAMIDLALEELNHFRQVYRLIEARGSNLTADVKDHYVNALRQHPASCTRSSLIRNNYQILYIMPSLEGA